jgi:hypothetical protein
MLAFLAPVDYIVNNYPTEVKAADFNGDGIQDLASTSGYNVSVHLGNADGTFQPRIITSVPHPVSMAVGDFNSDGKLDVATLSGDYSPGVTGIVSVLLGHGDGTFAYAPSPDWAEWGTAIATGDLNNDGKLDLVMSVVSFNFDGQDGSESIFELMLGNGDGTFTNYGQYAYSLGDFSNLALADVNGDGNLDIAAPGAVLLGIGNGLEFHPSALDPGIDLWSAFADFDGDGILDRMNRQGNTSLGVSLGHGDGSYPPPIIIPLGSNPGSFTVADFNGDGRPDVAVAMFYQNKVSVLVNDGHWSLGDPPTVSIRDATLTEGNTGTANATFTVILSNSTNVDVTVQYSTADITATAGSDYTATSGSVTIPAGQASKTFTVTVKGDRLPEPTETFGVNLSNPTNATIGDGQAIGTIVDNEPRVTISDVTKAEGRKRNSTSFTFTITLSAAYDQPVTLSYQTVNGTATTGDQDYVAKSGTITFAPGERVKTITITVKGDSKREANETFHLDLLDLSSNSLFTKNRGIGTILNED